MTIKNSLTGASALGAILFAAACTTAVPPEGAPPVDPYGSPTAMNTPGQSGGDVERVTEGNLVMENIPEIPAEVSEDLRRYQNVRTHGFADWTDRGVLVTTRFGEVNQVHRSI